jgi:superfamily II DNA or RNA helicase
MVRIRDERWRVARLFRHAGVSVLEVRGSDRSNRDAHTRFLLPFEPLERLPVSRAPGVVRLRRWRRMARNALAAAAPSFCSLRATAQADISVLPFQLEPALALVHGRAARILVADEVGLGKTIQAGVVIAELLHRLDHPHVLVVVPAALRGQWHAELEQRFRITTAIIDGITMPRSIGGALAGTSPWLLQPVVIASIDYVKKPDVLRALETTVWDLIVFDEAHALSTRSGRNTAAAALAERARSVMMLTATPHSGDDDEFRRLCSVGDIDRRFPLLVFRRTRADAGIHQLRRSVWLKVTPSPHERRMHDAVLSYTRLVWTQRGASSAEARLAAMVLARRACSSTTSLIRSLERRLTLIGGQVTDRTQLHLPLEGLFHGDDEPMEELAAPGLDDVKDEQQQLSTLLELARAAQAHESKLLALRRLLRRADEPAIVFTEYRDTLAPLSSLLADLEPVLLHGGLGSAERRVALQDFTKGRARVLLATDAASEGLNLHERCRLVIHLELPWTPRRLEQRVGRVERIGQSRTVHDVHLLAAGTFEDTTLASLIRRKDRADRVASLLRSHPPSEHDIAGVVLGREDMPTPTAGSSLPEGVVIAPLRAIARLETDRILLTRTLLTAPDELESPRPFVSCSRTPGEEAAAYLLFRLELLGADGRPLWESPLALHARLRHRPPHRARHIRQFLDHVSQNVAALVAQEHQAAAERLRDAMHDALTLAHDREQAIMAAARQCDARIAARLLQPSLFDRRAERQAADQMAALSTVLTLCEAQLNRIAQCRWVQAGSSEPSFALLRGR